MPSSEMDRLSNIIGMIYDCVLDPQNWDETLQAIVHEYRFSNCSLMAQELSSGQVTEHVAVGYDDIWLLNMGTQMLCRRNKSGKPLKK